jgi:N-acetylmuramoyl-L-alanine amidase
LCDIAPRSESKARILAPRRRHRLTTLGRVLPVAAGLLLAVATPRPARAGSAILVAGQPFDVGRPVVLWSDPEGFDGYAKTCIESRAIGSSPCCQRPFFRFGVRRELPGRTLPALQSVVRQVVLHLDGCVNSRSCFHSMHDMPRPDGGCGLSAHFMVDSDGIIYQTLDLLESAWHAEQANAISVGIEICNRGDASRNELDRLPADYRTRQIKDVVINGHSFHAYDFRPEQYASVLALVRVLVRVFPLVKPMYPERDGKPLLETLRDPNAFSGIVGHLHVDRERHKWDPGAFDWLRLKHALHGFHFPIAVRGYAEVPDEAEDLQRAAMAFFRNAEERASGFFPVGPSGLWHSGIHLRAVPGETVYAPVRGRLLAARLGEVQGSSTSLLLMRHEVDVAGARVTFYSLLAHLGHQDVSSQSEVPWIRDLVRAGDQRSLTALVKGEVALLDLPVEAGDTVGSVGWVRRGPEWGPEIHFEIFTAERPPPVLARTFRFMSAAADGLVMGRGGVIAPIDDNGDRRLTVDELRHFYREGDPTERQALRQMAFRHVHEWGDRLANPDEASGLMRGDRAREAVRRLRLRTTAAYAFWDARVGAHAGLPASQTIYSFHPITFLAALAAAEQGISLRWRARAAVADDDVTPAPPTVEDWMTPREVAEESQPIFGPVVGADSRIRRKAEIPLIVLPE